MPLLPTPNRPLTQLPNPANLPSRTSLRVVTSWAVDAVAWSIGLTLAVLARYEFAVGGAPLVGTGAMVILAIGLHTMLGHMYFLYRGRYAFGSFEEVRAVTGTVLVCVAVMVLAVLMA